MGDADGNTNLYIMADDKAMEICPSESEELVLTKEDEQEPVSVSSSVSPQRTQNQGGLMSASVADHTPAAALTGGTFLSELPHRGPAYAPTLLHTDLGQEQHNYMETNGLGGPHPGLPMQDMCGHPHDNSRRGSSALFSSPADFANASPASALYPTWHQATTAPSNPTVYSFNTHPQQQGPPHGAFTQPSVPIPQGQSYLGPGFDGIPRAPFDPAQDQLFRTGTMHNQGYAMHHPGSGLKVEPNSRGRMH